VPLALAAFLCLTPTIHDGDNIRCDGRTMRLAAIDAPELAGSPRCARSPRAWCDQRRAIAARDHLRKLVQRGPVYCRNVAPPDRYGRPIVRCSVTDIDLSEAQIRAGMARPWP